MASPADSASRSTIASDPPLLAFAPLPKPEGENALPLARAWLADVRAAIRKDFDAAHLAGRALRQWSDAVDLLLPWLLKQSRGEAEASLALVAIGGYGRRELFPYSDIDLLFLHAGKDAAEVAPVIERVCHALWDLGFSVGQAVRTPEETVSAAQAEHTVLTALLDARLVTGPRKLLTRSLKPLLKSPDERAIRAFTEAKLAERDARHDRHGNSRYLLEPQVKDGKGGLRDLHTLYWIARYAYGVTHLSALVPLGVLTAPELRRFRRAFEFLSVVRLAMHFEAGRAEERLTFDLQRRLAGSLGFRESEANRSVERFMKRYFRIADDVGNLTGLVCAALDEHQRRSPRRLWALWKPRSWRHPLLAMEGGRLTIASGEALAREPILMLEIFRHALEEGLEIHPYALQLLSRHRDLVDRDFQNDPAANAAFLSILLSKKNPEETLRRMREVGLLGRFLPDFGRVVGQMQFDMFHIYTVDEHILRAVGILHRLEQGLFAETMPIASEVVGQVQSRRVLYLAALTHDIAKGRGGNHAKKGAAIARTLAQRFGFTAAETESAVWLVRHHQEFSDTAHKRDLTDPDTLRHFVGLVQSLERLRLLLVLTVVDMQAVGPHIWNGWKAALLRDLYRRSEALIRTGATLSAEGRERVAAELATLLPARLYDSAARYVLEVDPGFLGSCPPEEHALIVRLLDSVWNGGEAMGFNLSSHLFHDISRVAVVAPDRAGLLADATGAMARAGLTVAGARITTLKSGMAVQLWQVQDLGAHAVTEEFRAETLRRTMQAALAGDAPSLPLASRTFARKTEAFGTAVELFFENAYSDTFTILEITAPDRVGLLHTLCRRLSDEGINIFSAHIGTYGEKAVDVFYIKDRFGHKIDHPGRIKALQEKLVGALE